MTTKSPFEVLDVSPDAHDAVVASAYKALARRFHPDTSLLDRRVAGERMAELNWAKAELEQNRAYWLNWSRHRLLIPGRPRERRALESAVALAARSIFVVPHMLWLPDRTGSSAIFFAYAPGVLPDDIRVRFNPRSFDVTRLASEGERAFFRITVKEAGLSKTKLLERLQVSAPDLSLTETVYVMFTVVAPPSDSVTKVTAKTPTKGSEDDWFLQRLGHVIGNFAGAK
jgi:hypothetical protein